MHILHIYIYVYCFHIYTYVKVPEVDRAGRAAGVGWPDGFSRFRGYCLDGVVDQQAADVGTTNGWGVRTALWFICTLGVYML